VKPVVENLERFLNWTCASCGEKLVLGKVDVDYLGSRFSIDLPKCEKCGLVMVPEELALGKMLEVEQILEDK
jgi:predicted RNA-binding Zn-ribbon protein involved in translation (DUF1610 family)